MIYKQLPNIKQYNRNGDKIDPFCCNFEMPEFSEVAYSGDYYDLSNIPDIISSDNSISITYPFSNDSDVNSFDLTLNTSMVELIDFTNFHNYYIREVTDWTSEHSANLKHHIVHCELAEEDLTIVDMSQSNSATTGVDRVFYYERNTTAASIVYIPLIAILGTDFTCSLNVSIQFGNTGEKFNTKCILLGDNPPDFTWCFCKNIPFNLVGQIDDRTPNGQLYEFIEIPEWFIGRIEISIYKIKPRVLGTIFTLTNNSNTPTVTEFIGSGTYELYPFTSLSSYSDSGTVRTFSTIVATSHDKYGVLDADFFVDNLSVLEKQSNNTIPDWIINDLYVHEVALRNRMNEIILRSIQTMIPTVPTNISSFTNDANYVTASQLPTVPSNIVLNKAEVNALLDRNIAIGNSTLAGLASNDENYPYIYYTSISSSLRMFKINGGSDKLSYAVEAGVTYFLTFNNTMELFTPSVGGTAIIIPINVSASRILIGNQWVIPEIGGVWVREIYQLISTANYVVCIIETNVEFGYNTSLINYCYKSNDEPSNIALGKNTSALGKNSIAIRGYSYADNSCSIGGGKAYGTNSIAIGKSTIVAGESSLAVGSNLKVNKHQSFAIGYGSYVYSTAGISLGNNNRVGFPAGNSYVLRTTRLSAISFTESNTSKVIYKGTHGENVTITVGGDTITTTPPDAYHLYLIVVNVGVGDIYGNLDGYALINGELKNLRYLNTNITSAEITTSCRALWIGIFNPNIDYNTINSFSFLGLYKSPTPNTLERIISVGNLNYCIEPESMAFGNGLQSAATRQLVIGTYNIPDQDAKFIIGGGTGDYSRKNILTIDDKEVMHVKGITNEIRTIDTEGNATNITNIQQGIIKVTGGGSITLSTSNTVEGLSVKIYASGSNVTVIDFSLTITACKWHEFIFLDGAWRTQE